MLLGSRIKDMTGKRCGLLTVLSYAGAYRKPGGSVAALWDCQCDCGNRVIVMGWGLRGGGTKSCGCARIAANKRRKRHGDSTAAR
jgi:hypothetical protein